MVILYHGTTRALESPIHPLGETVSFDEVVQLNSERIKSGTITPEQRIFFVEGLRRAQLSIKTPRSDFGAGFYASCDNDFSNIWASSQIRQSLGKDSKNKSAFVYTLEYDADRASKGKIKLFRFDTTDIRWILFIAFNRGVLQRASAPGLYDKISEFEKSYDVITGPTADDRIYSLCRDYISPVAPYSEFITHKHVLKALESANLSIQYVFKTPEVCRNYIQITGKYTLSESEISKFCELSDERYENAYKYYRDTIKNLKTVQAGLNFQELITLIEQNSIDKFENIAEEVLVSESDETR
ncbi:MAG: DUF3990 domain-containing protein [Synergistes sp.]|nr:DUF3990 domain-containing protein [Synergistes sp.]